MILSLSLLVLLIPGLLGSRPGECKRDKDREFKQVCNMDADCKNPDKKCCPTTSDGMVCRQPAQTCRQLDCGPSATCSHSSSSSLPFCDDCNPNQCQNGETCTDGDHSHSCACPGGFTGTNCQTNIDECNPIPCLNGGTCTDQVNSYTCTCPPCFTGDTCSDRLTATDRTVRLVNGSNPSNGRVEIYNNGTWGTVCDNNWGVDDAVVVCHQLGFSSEPLQVAAFANAHFGPGLASQPIWLDNVTCTRTESDLFACPASPLRATGTCSHNDDAGVSCPGFNSVGWGLPATQSSTMTDAGLILSAGLAVDGNTNTDLITVRSCSHTDNPSNVRNWWQIDLGVLYNVASVTITNRGEGFGSRLHDFDVDVFLLNPQLNATATALNCFHHAGAMEGGATITFPCSSGPIEGRFLRITNAIDSFLTLCEVAVNGWVCQ